MKKHSLIGLAALAICTAAAAQPYAVVSAGSARMNVDCTGVASCDKSDTAFKLLGGYRFAPTWAVEFGYFDFGKARAADAGVALEITNSALGVGVAFHQDLGTDWNAVARLGAARVKTKISGSVSGLGSASDSDNNVAAYGGLGVGYKLSPKVSLDLAWDFTRSQFKKDGLDETGNLNAVSLGLTFSF